MRRFWSWELSGQSLLLCRRSRNVVERLGLIYNGFSMDSHSLSYRLLSSNYGLYTLMFVQLLESAFLTSSCPREELFRIRQFGEAWMLSTGHASRTSDCREYSSVRQDRTKKWLASISSLAGDCALCYKVSCPSKQATWLLSLTQYTAL